MRATHPTLSHRISRTHKYACARTNARTHAQFQTSTHTLMLWGRQSGACAQSSGRPYGARPHPLSERARPNEAAARERWRSGLSGGSRYGHGPCNVTCPSGHGPAPVSANSPAGGGRHARSARAPEEHVADHVGRHQRRVQRRCFPRSAPQRRLHPSPQRLPRVGAGWSGCALHRNASCAGMRLAECRIACALLAPLPHHPIPPTPSARSMIVGWIAFQIYRRLERAIDRCSHPC